MPLDLQVSQGCIAVISTVPRDRGSPTSRLESLIELDTAAAISAFRNGPCITCLVASLDEGTRLRGASFHW